MRADRRWWIALCATLAACQGGDEAGAEGSGTDGPEAQTEEVVRSAIMPPPVSGGTLLLIDDDRIAVASDPDRDLIHVVDIAKQEQLHAIELPAGDEPGRLVADGSGRVHVVARRGGAIVSIDAKAGQIEDRRAVCPNPRGLAFEAETNALHVACAGGELVSLDAAGGEPWRRLHVAKDLRDVLVTDEGLAVSRFREADVLLLDDEGAVIEDRRLPVLQRMTGFDPPAIERLEPNTAWRTITTSSGEWLMLHQVSTERSLELTPPEDAQGTGGDSHDEGGEDGDPSGGSATSDGGGGGDGGYGSPNPNDPCGGAVHSTLTLGRESLSTRTTPLLLDTVLPVDVAITPSGTRVAVAVAGQRAEESRPAGVAMIEVRSFTTSHDPGCQIPEALLMPEGQYTAVAFDWRGWVVAQSRSPAQIVRIDPDDARHTVVVPLEGPPRRDTGHDLFHLDAGAGISCASCHPEGGDDGRVWKFREVGSRHTPSLAVGLAGTAPFHWQGELADMRALVDDVHVGRMGGSPLDDPHVDALESFLYAIPIPTPTRTRDDAATTRGEALFAQWGCGSCHAGQALASNANVQLGFAYGLQVPGLHGVAMHPPFMHDGRAADLPAAVLDMVERTRPDLPVPLDSEVDDMVAFLESL